MNVQFPAPRRNWPSLLLNLAVLIVVLAMAAGTFVLSYSGVHAIVLQAGVSPRLARIYPGLFDAVFVIACVAAVVLRDARWWARWYAWLVIILMVVVVGAADVVYAIDATLRHRTIEGVVAAAPWVLLLLAFTLMLTMLRQSRVQQAPATALAEPAEPAASACRRTCRRTRPPSRKSRPLRPASTLPSPASRRHPSRRRRTPMPRTRSRTWTPPVRPVRLSPSRRSQLWSPRRTRRPRGSLNRPLSQSRPRSPSRRATAGARRPTRPTGKKPPRPRRTTTGTAARAADSTSLTACLPCPARSSTKTRRRSPRRRSRRCRGSTASVPPRHRPKGTTRRSDRTSQNGRCHEAGRTRAVAIAAMPSPRPVSPSPSVVVAERLTGAPDSASLSTAIASARLGPTLGRLPMTQMARFPVVNPAAATSRAVSRSSATPGAPAHSGREVPKWVPRSPSPAADSSASQAAWAAASPSEWPASPVSPSHSSPARYNVRPASNGCTSTPSPTRGILSTAAGYRHSRETKRK